MKYLIAIILLLSTLPSCCQAEPLKFQTYVDDNNVYSFSVQIRYAVSSEMDLINDWCSYKFPCKYDYIGLYQTDNNEFYLKKMPLRDEQSEYSVARSNEVPLWVFSDISLEQKKYINVHEINFHSQQNDTFAITQGEILFTKTKWSEEYHSFKLYAQTTFYEKKIILSIDKIYNADWFSSGIRTALVFDLNQDEFSDVIFTYQDHHESWKYIACFSKRVENKLEYELFVIGGGTG